MKSWSLKVTLWWYPPKHLSIGSLYYFFFVRRGASVQTVLNNNLPLNCSNIFVIFIENVLIMYDQQQLVYYICCSVLNTTTTWADIRKQRRRSIDSYHVPRKVCGYKHCLSVHVPNATCVTYVVHLNKFDI